MNKRGVAAGAAPPRGFTLIELMIVVALIAIASAVASLALRDPSATQLEQEAARLAALLESARAQARATGLDVRWRPHPAPGTAVAPPLNVAGGGPASGEGADFDFIGLPASSDLPRRWLVTGVTAEVPGTGVVSLGPEPLIGAQRIVLSLNERRLTLATDGLGPFAVVDELAPPAR